MRAQQSKVSVGLKAASQRLCRYSVVRRLLLEGCTSSSTTGVESTSSIDGKFLHHSPFYDSIRCDLKQIEEV